MTFRLSNHPCSLGKRLADGLITCPLLECPAQHTRPGPHAGLEGSHTESSGAGKAAPASITPNGGLCLNSDESLLRAFSTMKELKRWTPSSVLARGDEWRLSLFGASSPSEEILDSAGKGKQFFIWEALFGVQSCIQHRDFLLDRDSAAHSCPLVLCLAAKVCSAGHLKDTVTMSPWWGAEPALVVLAVPGSCELQGAAGTGQRHRACVCRAMAALGSLLWAARAAANTVLTHIMCHFSLSISQKLEGAKLLL